MANYLHDQKFLNRGDIVHLDCDTLMCAEKTGGFNLVN